MRRKAAPGLVYRGLEKSKSFRIECRERDHYNRLAALGPVSLTGS
jgi:hypothetical protein